MPVPPKIHILTTCPNCQGKAYLPAGEAKNFKGETYVCHLPCPQCEGSGLHPSWISLPEFVKLLQSAPCLHQYTSFRGGMHFSEGEVWDDIEEVCNDCGSTLEGQILGDFIQDDN